MSSVSSCILLPSVFALAAISEGTQIGLVAAGITANAVQAAILWRLLRSQRDQDAKIAKIEKLETQKESSTALLVQAEIDRKTGELNACIRELTGEIKRINQRLDDGDNQFEKIGEKGQAMQILLANQTAELQRWMLETFASKKEVELVASRIDSLGAHLHGVEIEAVKAAVTSAAGGKKQS